MSNSFILAQAIGLCAMMFTIVAWQMKNTRMILACYAPSSLLFAIQYLLLGAPIGCVIALCGATKDGMIGLTNIKNIKPLIYLYLVSIWGIGLCFIENWYGLLPMVGGSLFNISLLSQNNRALHSRVCIIAALLGGISYGLIVHAWMAVACSSFVIVSSIIGMARHEEWKVGKCYRSSLTGFSRSLFAFPNF